MVSRDKVSGFSLVERIRLTGFHDVFYEAISEMDRMEVFVVISAMSPLISLTKRDEQKLGMVIPDGLDGVGVSDSIRTLTSFRGAEHAFLEPVDHLQAGAGIGRHIGLIGSAARETATFIIDCETD